jgi:glycine oxidase
VKTWDVIIAGGGIIGLSLALELRERGAGVLVLDRGEPGREASSAAAGMLAPTDPATSVELRQFAVESARLYPGFVQRLESAAETTVDFRRHGTVVLHETHDAPSDNTRLSAEELKQLEPALQPGPHFAFFLQENSVDPDFLSQAAVKAVRACGVEMHSHTAVQRMSSQNGTIEVNAGAGRFAARVAVNCQGAWAGAPVRPRKGQMCYLRPQNPDLLRRVVRAPDVYLVPRSSGKILVGATVEDAGFDKSVETETVNTLYRGAAALVPELAAAPMVESWAGLRPGTPDDLPVMGETETPGIMISSGHFRNGILLAPAAAKIMADVIMGRSPEIDISAFSPARFASVRG